MSSAWTFAGRVVAIRRTGPFIVRLQFAMTLESLLESATAPAIPHSEIAKEAFGNDPELQGMISEFAQRMNQAAASKDSQQVHPIPGFVVKTRLEESLEDYPAGMKVFINICHSKEIPAPPLCSDQEIQKYLVITQSVKCKR